MIEPWTTMAIMALIGAITALAARLIRPRLCRWFGHRWRRINDARLNVVLHPMEWDRAEQALGMGSIGKKLIARRCKRCEQLSVVVVPRDHYNCRCSIG